MVPMPKLRAVDHSNVRRLAVAFVGLLTLVAACESAESKQMKTLAGTYVWEYETDPATDPGHMWLHEKATMTLRADGTWALHHIAEIQGKSDNLPQNENGSYRVQGVTLVLGATENAPARKYTISGDTLWIKSNAEAAALAKAVTGVDPVQSNTDAPDYFVRVR